MGIRAHTYASARSDVVKMGSIAGNDLNDQELPEFAALMKQSTGK